jgi:thioredoxin domain-containing protein 5
MTNLFISFSVLILTFTSVYGEESASNSDVVILTSQNFEHLTQAATGATTGDWLVEFYAPWCGHCKKLHPVWEELATDLKGVVNVAKVDVTAHPSLGSRFDIKGFPTVKFFHHGEVFDYSGSRKKEAFAEFVTVGYKSTTGIKVPLDKTLMDKIKKPFLDAMSEIKKGNYTSPEVIVLALPVVVLFVMIISLTLLGGEDEVPTKQEKTESASTGNKESVASSTKKGNKKD